MESEVQNVSSFYFPGVLKILAKMILVVIIMIVYELILWKKSIMIVMNNEFCVTFLKTFSHFFSKVHLKFSNFVP